MLQTNQESLKQVLQQETIVVKTETNTDINEDNKESIQLEEGALKIENSACILPDVKSNSDDTVLFSYEKCNECYASLEQSQAHTCENKEFVMKFDDEINETTDYDANSNEDKTYKHLEKCLKCALCDHISETKPQLTKHMQQVHNRDTIYICSFCNKGFKQSCHLREHISMHTGERNFCCSICGKTFFRASSQRRHLKGHDAPPGQKTKRTPFLCTICGKSFPFSNGVQRHMRIHFGIKKYECQVCERKFMQSTHLLVHMRTHTGEKPYICDICGEAFALNCTLQKHMKVHSI